MSQFTEEELIAKVQDGYIVESVDEMTEGYRKALRVQLTVQADTELMSAPAYWMAARYAPSTNTQVSAHAIIQDELAHANIAYRLLEDIGESKEHLVYGRQPHEFKHPYGFDQPLDNWAELVVATGFFDRAGITLLTDVHENTSYGPLKRALVKIGMEETFHLRHGEVWMRRLSKAGGEAKEMVQRCVDWMFPMTIEWFGLPDDMKRHSGQLDYKLKGLTNDQLRQVWMASTVPLCEQLGLDAPAHWDEEKGEYVLDYPFPCQYNEEEKRWMFEEGEISWDTVFKRWKGRGPMNEIYVESVQRSRGDVKRLLNGKSVA
ncbi:MAG: phenylacetate-CoA oxygenase subunit PaaI [Gemmatimonadales bacterium]|jgi:ring-1,2-phenylacetyl-CoA epoxidase subunit PaaA|nr:phenylacetate-CoA oxygenase subunit PaaI [Gemmatimonadales bacterium]MDG2239660.1 phenylacetate-CoA oxygenase subunit PaaI [Longimicrobiales bacterium]MBT3500235.1 phenylacetate-CoA oxygenase subunit PaaI [Gemmatimonadales bacterium]MBT3775614.1 phenylacetate-CoA oxygenase subunit PaaI [Gemmatimonadales bacterium]MBT3957604.1 phenylacetate-CoA oxygenase subunit PaaI [Gemmatimonadales bacterium]